MSLIILTLFYAAILLYGFIFNNAGLVMSFFVIFSRLETYDSWLDNFSKLTRGNVKTANNCGNSKGYQIDASEMAHSAYQIASERQSLVRIQG